MVLEVSGDGEAVKRFFSTPDSVALTVTGGLEDWRTGEATALGVPEGGPWGYPRAILLGGYSATVSWKLSKYLDEGDTLRIRGDCNPYRSHIIPYISGSIPYNQCGMHPQLGAWECS